MLVSDEIVPIPYANVMNKDTVMLVSYILLAKTLYNTDTFFVIEFL